MVEGHSLERIHTVKIRLVCYLTVPPELMAPVKLNIRKGRCLSQKLCIILPLPPAPPHQMPKVLLISHIRHPEVLRIDADTHMRQRLPIGRRQSRLHSPIDSLIRNALLKHLYHPLQIPRPAPLPGNYPVQILPGDPSRPLPLGQMLIHIAIVRLHIGRNLGHVLPQEFRQRLQQPLHILLPGVLVVIVVNLAPPVVVLHHMQVRVPFVAAHRNVIPL